MTALRKETFTSFSYYPSQQKERLAVRMKPANTKKSYEKKHKDELLEALNTRSNHSAKRMKAIRNFIKKNPIQKMENEPRSHSSL